MIYLEIGIIIILGIGIALMSKKSVSLLKTLNKNKKTNEDLVNKYNVLEQKYNDKKESLSYIKKDIQEHAKAEEKILKLEYDNKKRNLETEYTRKQQEYVDAVELLNKSYSEIQDNILLNLDEENTKLDRIKELRIAAQEAITREKEIKENQDFYCLKISLAEKSDIKILDKVKEELNHPRLLCMLIWQSFFKQSMNTLCNNILGLNTVTGIYKITNIKTDECYIGQAVDVAKRWKDHAKHGLGIDTPKGNKLYAAMAAYGLWNFSWELIEKCSRDLLNEKEKYYIDLYMSNEYGYNSQKGNSKNGTR